MLTKRQILAQLEKDGIDLGANPERVFNFYLEKKLIQPSIKRKNRLGLYAYITIERIKKIKQYQNKGKTLAEIEKIFLKVDKNETYEKQKEYLNNVGNQLRHHEMIIKILKLEEDSSYDLYYIDRANTGEYKWSNLVVIALNEEDGVVWYCIDFSKPSEEKILSKTKMSFGEYAVFLQTLGYNQMKEGKVLRRKEIFEAAFRLYLT
jgi:DNA-binding transcriptional MerR regulator